MIQKILRHWSLVAVSLLLVGLLVWPIASGAKGPNPKPTPTPTPSLTATSCSGDAFAVKATLLGITIGISDTGPLASCSDAREASLLESPDVLGLGLLALDVLHATTIGGNPTSSEASVASLSLTVAGNTISADVLMASAEAKCTSGGPSVSGGSEIVGLVINGQAIVVTGQPNQTVNLLIGKVIINEQTGNGTNDITVNALHVAIPGVADVIISHAHADITCGPSVPVCPGKDFVTGGGFITGTPSGAKGTFGVAGGIKNGAFWGHLEYIDHGSGGPKVHGTGVTAYTVTGTTSRRIQGTCEINGQGGFTYRVDVADNGEPGRNDTFSISLSNGYNAGGFLEGGNIQLHKPQCPN